MSQISNIEAFAELTNWLTCRPEPGKHYRNRRPPG